MAITEVKQTQVGGVSLAVTPEQARHLLTIELDRAREALAAAEARCAPLKERQLELASQLDQLRRDETRLRHESAMAPTPDAYDALQADLLALVGQRRDLERERRRLEEDLTAASNATGVRHTVRKLEGALGLRPPLLRPSPFRIKPEPGNADHSAFWEATGPGGPPRRDARMALAKHERLKARVRSGN